MHTNNNLNQGQPIEDRSLLDALTALGRAINIATTYGMEHPAFQQAVDGVDICMKALFLERKKVHIGAIKGTLSIDQKPVAAKGTLLKSLERRLNNLQITSLKIAQGISTAELTQLISLLTSHGADAFQTGMSQSNLSHIESENMRYEAVEEGQVVANESDLAGSGDGGVLVLEDDKDSGASDEGGGDSNSSVHVDQIVAFLKGDMDLDDANIGDELTEMASNPERLGQMIMESVSIRQEAAELSGESLGDIVLGCLRRTFDGLRQQPAFKSTEGTADLKKSLLLLEETMLNKMRGLAGEENPELDRTIVQAVREMDEQMGFELAAKQYMEQRDAMEEQKQQLQSFIQTKGMDVAEEILAESDFPASDWKRIVVESQKKPEAGGGMVEGLNSLARVFEQMENLMKSDSSTDGQVIELLGQANHDLDDTIYNTREKLNDLSKKLGDSGTIGGQGQMMTREELLRNIAEVAQELMQPLTAIKASVEMMLHGFVGDVNHEQREILNLAHSSSDHLRYLMDELINIVGCPTNKGVDDRFHTTSDEVALMNKS